MLSSMLRVIFPSLLNFWKLTLRYDQKRWKIVFSDSRRPRFKAWGEEIVA
jgi:hypothetical protein